MLAIVIKTDTSLESPMSFQWDGEGGPNAAGLGGGEELLPVPGGPRCLALSYTSKRVAATGKPGWASGAVLLFFFAMPLTFGAATTPNATFVIAMMKRRQRRWGGGVAAVG